MSKRKLTIDDVAQRAGVSKALVSFALNDRPGVAAETRSRILAVANEMGWQPDMKARALSTSRSLAYGLVIARDPNVLSADTFFPTFIAGVERAISESGHVLVLSVVDSLETELATYRSLIETGRVDGLFLTDIREADPRVELIRELGARAVALGPLAVASSVPVVAMPDHSAAYALVNRLADDGHETIALVVGPNELLHAVRWKDSLIEALLTRGLRADLVRETDFSSESGSEATTSLLAEANRPTAIIYANDHMAVAGMAIARRAGLDVPGDISVAGYGGSNLGTFVYPSLTTIEVDIAGWGYASAGVLMQLADGHVVEIPELRGAELVVRESTGPASKTGIVA